MNADERRSELDLITEKIIGCAHQVGNTLGAGFLEKIYENALAIELREAGLSVEQQHPIYLKATGLSVCLLINFGVPKVVVKRIVRNFQGSYRRSSAVN